MKDVTSLFFDLIRASLGNKDMIEPLPTEKEWLILFELANKQSLTSVLLEGVNKLKNSSPNTNLNISQGLLLEWIGTGLQTENKNKIQNERSKQLYEIFKEVGYRSCVLKGQGTAQYYDHPERRQCGDIDIWVEGDRDKILDFAKSRGCHIGHVDIKHSDIDFFEDVPVEVHFLPSWMYCPSTNRKLQLFFGEMANAQYSNFDESLGFAHSTIVFDLVFSIVHIYRHIFSEGIGLRQLVDYYYILKRSTQIQRNDSCTVLSEFRMKSFIGGIMWILRDCFGLEENGLLCPVNAKHGQFLLSEIMTAGNFGHYDYRRKERGNLSKFGYGLIQFKKNLRFLNLYPSEVLWSPFWKTWHFFWRKRKGYL